MLAAHVERGAKNHYNRIAGAVFEGVFFKVFVVFFFLAYLFSFCLFFSLFFQLCSSSSIFDENFGIGIILDTSSAGYHFSYFFS